MTLKEAKSRIAVLEAALDPFARCYRINEPLGLPLDTPMKDVCPQAWMRLSELKAANDALAGNVDARPETCRFCDSPRKPLSKNDREAGNCTGCLENGLSTAASDHNENPSRKSLSQQDQPFGLRVFLAAANIERRAGELHALQKDLSVPGCV